MTSNETALLRQAAFTQINLTSQDCYRLPKNDVTLAEYRQVNEVKYLEPPLTRLLTLFS